MKKYIYYIIKKYNIISLESSYNNNILIKFRNSKYFEIYNNIIIKKINNNLLQQIYISNHILLNNNYYNCKCEIDNINEYTIFNNIDISKYSNSNKEILVYNCLQQILNNKKILNNGKIVNISDCIICDYFLAKVTKFNNMHTDLEYDLFQSNAFNVWYLIENNYDYGNMFLLETEEYDKKYTPCILDNYSCNHADVIKNTITHSLLNYNESIGKININNASIKYLNIKNGECLVMSKHMLHSTDLRRQNNQIKGFNFRVIIKNKDGSINFNGNPNKIKANHVYKNNKLYNVDMFDFI